jgi:hypothetical protein
MMHGDIGHFPSFALDQRDQIAVDMVEIGQGEKSIAPECLEATAGVGGAVLK